MGAWEELPLPGRRKAPCGAAFENELRSRTLLERKKGQLWCGIYSPGPGSAPQAARDIEKTVIFEWVATLDVIHAKSRGDVLCDGDVELKAMCVSREHQVPPSHGHSMAKLWDVTKHQAKAVLRRDPFKGKRDVVVFSHSVVNADYMQSVATGLEQH